MKSLLLECSSTLTCEMLVGALCDLGVQPSSLEWELSQIELGAFHLHFERETYDEISGIHFSIHEGATHQPEQDEDHASSHEDEHVHVHEDGTVCHHHHHDQGDGSHPAEEDSQHDHDHTHDLRSLEALEHAFERSNLSVPVKDRAWKILQVASTSSIADSHFLPDVEVAAATICLCSGLESLGIQQIHLRSGNVDSLMAAILKEYPMEETTSSLPVEKTGTGLAKGGVVQARLSPSGA